MCAANKHKLEPSPVPGEAQDVEGDRLMFVLGTVCDTDASGSCYDADTRRNLTLGKHPHREGWVIGMAGISPQ